MPQDVSERSIPLGSGKTPLTCCYYFIQTSDVFANDRLNEWPGFTKRNEWLVLTLRWPALCGHDGKGIRSVFKEYVLHFIQLGIEVRHSVESLRIAIAMRDCLEYVAGLPSWIEYPATSNKGGRKHA